MDIKFPEQRDEFPSTLAKFLVSVLAALAVGMFLGHALGAFFGTDESVIVTSVYTDRMSAIRTVFTDGDQLDSFSRTALEYADKDGLTLLASRDRDRVMRWSDGLLTDETEASREEIQKSLLELMHTEDGLYGVTDAADNPIDDVWLRNISVKDGVVYYYLYYDEYGYAGVAYDSTGNTLTDTDGALPLTRTESGVYEWFIIYDMGDV